MTPSIAFEPPTIGATPRRGTGPGRGVLRLRPCAWQGCWSDSGSHERSSRDPPERGNTRPSGWLNADLVARGGIAGVE